MKQTRILWDMPITLCVKNDEASPETFEEVYAYFQHVDDVFNTFKPDSEISRVNRGEISRQSWSPELAEVVALCEKTHAETNGYFSHMRDAEIHPLGLVKGWALHKAAGLLKAKGAHNFFVDAGGDVEICGTNELDKPWSVGIRDPFYQDMIVKKLSVTDCGVATSGTYIRGYHIYSPLKPSVAVTDVLSLTVVGANVYEADRFATAAFAMGKSGIEFIESLKSFEAYQIDERGIATYTSGFDRFVDHYGCHKVD
jgi:thiamine biosynthesis lipoprotein